MRHTCPERGLEGDAPDRQPGEWTSTDLLVKESLIALSTFVSPCGSAGKESTCKGGATWVRSLGWEDPPEKGKATHCSILAWRIPGLSSPWGHKESDMIE